MHICSDTTCRVWKITVQGDFQPQSRLVINASYSETQSKTQERRGRRAREPRGSCCLWFIFWPANQKSDPLCLQLSTLKNDCINHSLNEYTKQWTACFKQEGKSKELQGCLAPGTRSSGWRSSLEELKDGRGIEVRAAALW